MNQVILATTVVCDYCENTGKMNETSAVSNHSHHVMSNISFNVNVLQVGDFLLLHLLGQNMNMVVFGEILDELSRRLNDYMHNNVPTAPSTLEMSPIYPSKEKFPKETEA